MKKALLLIPFYSSFYKPIKKAFNDLGYETKSYDYRRGGVAIRILRFIPIIGKQLAENLINGRIVTLATDFKPQIILTVKGESLNNKVIKSIKKADNKVVNWFPDPLNTWNLMFKIAPYYDYFLHFDPLIVKKLRTLGFKNVHYLPFAAEIVKKMADKKIYDVSFVGTYSKDREKKLSNLTNFDLNIWGDSRWFDSSLKKFTRGARVSQKKMKDIIKKSKININIHHNESGKGANLRTFETTGSGGFLLTDYVDDLKNLFTINKDIACFENATEMSFNVRYFLKNNKYREKISSNGYKKAVNIHKYTKRINQMMDIIRT